MLRGSKFLTQLLGNDIEDGVGSMPENVEEANIEVCIEVNPVIEEVATTEIEVDNEFVPVASILDGCIVEVCLETAEVDIIVVVVAVVLVILTDAYPIGGHSSGEWNPTLSRDHVSSRAPE